MGPVVATAFAPSLLGGGLIGLIAATVTALFGRIAGIAGNTDGVLGFRPGPDWTALPLLAPGTLVFLAMMLVCLWRGSHGKSLDILTSKGAF